MKSVQFLWLRRGLAALVIVVVAVAGGVLAGRKTSRDAVVPQPRHTQNVVALPPDNQAPAIAPQNSVDIQTMLPGYCFAGSSISDDEAPGGFGPSKNLPRRFSGSKPGSGLYLLAQPDVVTKFSNRPAMRLVLVNQTEDLLAFPASDSRIAIIQEAKNKDGVWQPIESLPPSDCGNSYHRVFLPAGHYWEFSAPRYFGSMPTKLRFTLRLPNRLVIHSNEFSGSVNPEQFTAKPGQTSPDIDE